MRIRPDPTAPFPVLLGHLVWLLRTTPERDDLITDALAMVTARVAKGPALIEAGTDAVFPEGDPLKDRLKARQVDAIRVASATPENELMNLALALADDRAPIASTAGVRVRLIPDPLPPNVSGPRSALSDPDLTVLPRGRPGDQLAQLIDGIFVELDKAIQRQFWHAALHDAQAAVRLLPGLAEDAKRLSMIAFRRLLKPPVMEAFVELAYRAPEEQPRTAEVLAAVGLPGAELMLDLLNKADSVGPRMFLVEALGGMPEALPLVAALVKSTRPAEVRLGAELLGRLGLPEGIPLLAAQAMHKDERVRMAVIDALTNYPDKGVVEPLRQALSHASPATRAHAGRALATRGSAAIAMPIAAALDTEKDPVAWEKLLSALASIDAPESAAALAQIALQKRGLFPLGSALIKRQMAVVKALFHANTAAARQALARIASEGDGEVKRLAASAVEQLGQTEAPLEEP